MKLMNYDSRYLIYSNVKSRKREEPQKYTKRQYEILCNLIRCKGITKQFFEVLLMELFDLTDWREMNYQQMYELIYILTNWNYRKEH